VIVLQRPSTHHGQGQIKAYKLKNVMERRAHLFFGLFGAYDFNIYFLSYVYIFNIIKYSKIVVQQTRLSVGGTRERENNRVERTTGNVDMVDFRTG
jgi:hypothetical protein